MEIRLYKNFVKGADSTKQPTGNYVTKQVQLKEETSVISPTFLLSDYDEAYNYVYVPAWNRYYFKNDCTLNINHLFELSLTFDHLATYKSSIGAYTCFVERSQSNFDNLINDPMVSQKQYIVHESSTSTSFGSTFNTAGSYIVRTKASSSDSDTGINTYALNKGQLSQFLNDAFNVGNYGDVFTELADNIVKSVFNPLDYVISICWVPFSAQTIANTNDTKHIKLGWWQCPNAFGYSMNASAFTFNVNLELPDSYFSDWRDYNPNFTNVQMILPCVGLIDFDPIQMCYPNDTSVRLNVLYSIDTSTGEGEVFLRNKSSDGKIVTISKFKANTCSNIQIAQTSFNLTGSVSDTISSIGGLMSGNVPLTVMSGISAISNIVKPNVSMIGINGSQTSINNYLESFVNIRI